jgi:hypothetical protein
VTDPAVTALVARCSAAGREPAVHGLGSCERGGILSYRC